EGRAGERTDRADRDRAAVVHLDRERLAEADEHDEGDEREGVVVGAEQEPQHARSDSDHRNEPNEECEAGREREEAWPVNRMRPGMPALLRWDQLDRR